jgi:hypothetical protein
MFHYHARPSWKTTTNLHGRHINSLNHNLKTVNCTIPYATGNPAIETFKPMILLRKKDNLMDDEFADYWLAMHAPLARKMPGVRK